MACSVDFFFSFRSPYSYLAVMKLRTLAGRNDVIFNLRPVYPIAVRLPGYFQRNPKFAAYVLLDSRRTAKFEGIPFRFPKPDPIVQDMTTLEIAAEQPYISRLTRLAAAAQMAGRSMAFVDAIAPVLWDGQVNGWNTGDHLAKAATDAGFDLAAFDAAIEADPEGHEQVIRGNEDDHAASGHWGVPTFVLDGEPFFGQDRIPTLLWRVAQRNQAAAV